MKLILAIPTAAGLLFSGSLSLNKMSHLRPAGQTALQTTSAVAVVSKPRMWADITTVYNGESLQLRFETPHDRYLGVIDPDGHFFYVVFPAEDCAGNLEPLVSSEQFAAMNVLAINTSTFKADPYTYGILENKPVFTKTGVYRFLLGDNLHTDDECFLTILKINYLHVPRPAQTVAGLCWWVI